MANAYEEQVIRRARAICCLGGLSNWDDGFDSRMAEAAGIPKPNVELATRHGFAPPEWVRGRQDAEDYLSKEDGK